MTARTSPRLPRYKRAASPPPMQLTDRDEQIIEWVYQLRFATAEQIQALLFAEASASSCRHRLTLLYHNGYLDRRLLPLSSAFGANRAVYCLDRRGAELLSYRNKTGTPVLWRPADNDRELYFLQHLVDSNDFRVSATLGAMKIGTNIDWLDERTLRTNAMKQMVKDPRRQGQLLAVIPDGYFSLEDEGRRQGFALELDRSTVEEKRFRTKVRALGEWRVTGAYKNRHARAD